MGKNKKMLLVGLGLFGLYLATRKQQQYQVPPPPPQGGGGINWLAVLQAAQGLGGAVMNFINMYREQRSQAEIQQAWNAMTPQQQESARVALGLSMQMGSVNGRVITNRSMAVGSLPNIILG